MKKLEGIIENHNIAGVIDDLRGQMKNLAQQKIGKTGSLAAALEKELQQLAAVIAILEMLQSLGQDANLKDIYDTVENNKKLEMPKHDQQYKENDPYAIPTEPRKK